ncbi:MAG: C4-type zinc ribbon domain-containing protein, partial [Desulfatirhabdiaceae bacterium]|nr:C4-type zinc ribbon domain-containing protein [Desulfatirhabdiaceae bacterium]
IINPNIAGIDMKDQIAILVSLQQIEIESSSVKIHLCSVSKRLDLLNNSQNELKQRITDESAKIEEWRKQYRSYESDIKQNQVMIKRSQDRLNSIKNNREYQALLKEIEELKRTNAAIEDQMIDCLNQVDDSEKKTAATHEELQLLENDLLQEQQLVGVATENAGKRLNELDLERQEISSKIEADVLKLFRKVQSQQVRGNAVVPVQDAVCHGCYVNIPPQMYNELQRCDKLRMCPNCQRIIYWKQI